MRYASVCLALLASGALAQDLREGERLLPQDQATAAFGESAVLADGFAAIGTTNDGRVHVFAPFGGGWVEREVITSVRWQAKGLGKSMDIQSDDGGILVAGAPYPYICDPDEGPSSTGEVVVFRRVESGGLEYLQTLRHDGVDRLDRFGGAVAIDEDLIVVSARYDNEAGHSAGAAYVFRNTGGVWEQEAKLIGDLTDESDILGWGVAVDQGRVVLGAPFRSDNGLLHTGSALVFEQINGQWRQVARLTSPNPEQQEYFGVSVAVEGDAIVVGATGSDSAYAYERQPDGTWAFAVSLDPQFGQNIGGRYDFGGRVMIDGGRAIVSAPHFKQGQLNIYSVGNGWPLEQQIVPDGFRRGAQFGSAIASSRGQLLIGARGATNDESTGAAMMLVGGRDLGQADAFGDATPCEADINGDGTVDSRDFVGYFTLWTDRHDRADMNADGVVNTLDVPVFLAMWNQGC